MLNHQIDKNYELGFESLGKRIRIIVFKDKEEFVCRKEYTSKLEKYLESDEVALFKGRLQLEKQNDHILLKVKGAIIGQLESKSFVKYISK